MPDIQRPLKRRARVVVLVGVAVLLLGACGSAASTPAAQPESAASPTYDPTRVELTSVPPEATNRPQAPATTLATPSPGAGLGSFINVDFAAPPTAEEYATWFGMYVMGRVTEILPAQWSTPDGKRPPGITQSYLETDTYTIITPAVVNLDGPPLLNRYGIDVSSGSIIVAAFGGNVGENSIDINDPSQHLHVGDHLLIGVMDRPYMGTTLHVPYWTPAGPAWTFGMTYHLESDGLALASMPNATPVATQDLIQAIKDAAQAEP